MTSDSDFERRLSRVENDTGAIYEILGEISQTQRLHTRLLDKMGGRLDKVEGRIGKSDGRLDKIETRLDRMDERFDRMDERFDRMDERFDRMDERFDGIETTLVEVVRRLPAPPE